MQNPPVLTRIIDQINGSMPGPWIIVVAGIYGNEMASVKALENLMKFIKLNEKNFNGQFLALRGNLTALKHHMQYIDEDMNRLWHMDVIQQIRQTPKQEIFSFERREIKALFSIIDNFLPRQISENQPIVFIDLHSSSSNSTMFGITNPNQKNIELFSGLNIPLIMDTENHLQGTAFAYYQQQGFTSVTIEGGGSTNSIMETNISTVMLSILEKLECIPASILKESKQQNQSFNKQSIPLPNALKIMYKHPTTRKDDFVMKPGYKSLQKIKKNEFLAKDREGVILSPMEGYILLPRYESQGTEGFFIAQELNQEHQ